MTVVLNNLSGTISNVIEELALMAVETPQEQPELIPQIAGWIDLEGSAQGRLYARCGEGLALSLASNLLGVQADDPKAEEIAIDAFKEMLNVLAGHLVTKLFGSEHAFTLSIPTGVRLDGAGHPDETDTPNHTLQESCTLLLDDQPIEFTLSLFAEH